MGTAILLAVAASMCTATASVCQRIGARSTETAGFDVWLLLRLARRPVWLLGVVSVIGGFVLQLIALRYGALALVQPILALELLFVFGYLAVAGAGRVKMRHRDWLAAVAMSVGIGVPDYQPRWRTGRQARGIGRRSALSCWAMAHSTARVRDRAGRECARRRRWPT